MSAFKMDRATLRAGDWPYEADANARLASEIRQFRPGPVANLSDKQLVWVIGRSRRAARALGISDRKTLKQWIMIDALLAPGFCAVPEVAEHFSRASGEPDVKAEDIFAQIKAGFRANGRGPEIWW